VSRYGLGLTLLSAVFLGMATRDGSAQDKGNGNLLANGGFEEVTANGRPRQWRLAQEGEGKTSLVVGQSSDRRGSVAELSFTGLKWAYIDQHVPGELAPEDEYVFSVELKASAATKVDIAMMALAVKDHIDALSFGRKLNPAVASLAAEAGVRIYCYANPLSAPEVPETYRRNYGLRLWKAGYTGHMNYAYNAARGYSQWNDFDYAPQDTYHERDYCLAYTTSNGVVDTVQWEGFREGVDDVRYLSTLLEAMQAAKQDPARAAVAGECEKFARAGPLWRHGRPASRDCLAHHRAS